MVFCEGTRTEPDYLEALGLAPSIREFIALEINEDRHGQGAVPLTLVKWAVQEKERCLIEERDIDGFWCIFDVEWPKNHPNLAEAVELAREHGIQVAISNPNFELWLALHYCHYIDWLTSAAATGLRQSYDGSSDKGVDTDLYLPKRHIAVKHARYLDGMHARNETIFPCDNPSSGMYKFLDAIEGTS